MTILFLILAMIAVLALLGSYGSRTWYGARPTRRIVQDTFYEDEPEIVEEDVLEEVVEDDVVEDYRPVRPVRTVRRRSTEY